MLPLVALAALAALSFPAKRRKSASLGQSMGSEKKRFDGDGRVRVVARSGARSGASHGECARARGERRDSTLPGARGESNPAPGPGALLPPAPSPPPRSSNRFAPSFFASHPACRRGRRPRSASERDVELRSLTLWCHGVRSALLSIWQQLRVLLSFPLCSLAWWRRLRNFQISSQEIRI